MFEFHDNFFAVMSDTPHDGVTITGYPYPDNPPTSERSGVVYGHSGAIRAVPRK